MTAPRRLTVQPATAAAFAPYGWLIDAAAQAPGRRERAINAGTSRRIDGLGELHLAAAEGRAGLAIFQAQAQALEGPWQQLERHRQGTQSFIPLTGARWVLLVACSAPQALAPDTASLAAFALHGHQGATLHPGTWHHGLIALDAGDFVVIERFAATEDCDLAALAPPVRLQR